MTMQQQGQERNAADLHIPVLMKETLAALQPVLDAGRDRPVRILDGTLGMAGHSEKLNSVPLPSMKLSHVKTKLLGLAQRMVPDAQGRIRIPQPLMRAAGLQKDVVLVGMADKFEIWDQARFDALLVEDVSDEVAACHLDIAL
ncbi:16S rRNA (cytosine(1402)-N(4))-methyltransferase [uncultured Desulfovibrio sp.]|uniref:16S rRNA (cytosine(1402)-N(4))-methyltransferase n=1 Tax=uncultured Desulfovibrio sp. TaxID=167968 RepID=UPI00260AD0B1|nr:16S rRNA (cytosine(1402)-N(4))-methyltransferase [uncultured Desulfovibrio sp.]